MVSKKGYMRTLEVVLAMILTFAFVLYISPDNLNQESSDPKGVLISLKDDEVFRASAMNTTSCVYKGENKTVNSFIDDSLDTNLNYAFCSKGTLPTLPRKKVNVESIYLTGNITDFDEKIVRLYYWE